MFTLAEITSFGRRPSKTNVNNMAEKNITLMSSRISAMLGVKYTGYQNRTPIQVTRGISAQKKTRYVH